MRARGRGGRGFSLAELLVALAILLIGLAIAAELGARAQKILGRSLRDARRPPVEAALGRIRLDVQGASGYAPPSLADPLGWSREPLTVAANPLPVRFEEVAGRLVRVATASDGTEVSRRVLVADLTDWRWRAVSPGLVEISFTSLREPGAPGAAGSRVERTSLLVALRGAQGGAAREVGW